MNHRKYGWCMYCKNDDLQGGKVVRLLTCKNCKHLSDGDEDNWVSK